MPNVVVTSVAAQGLLEATEAGLIDAGPDLARIGRFCIRRLMQEDADGNVWYAYTPGDTTMIHNGSALSIRALQGVGGLLGDAEMVDAAAAGVRTLARYQRPDGSWRYAENRIGDWVDGFHTGFILEMLGRRLASSSDATAAGLASTGGDYYVRRLFGSSGQPRYASTRPLPYDAMSAAQALEVLPLISAHVAGAPELLRLVETWVADHMLLGGGRVAYQVHRRWIDVRQFPRWSLAPMAAAIAGLPPVGDAGGGCR